MTFPGRDLLVATVEAAGLGVVVDADPRTDGAVATAGIVTLADGATRFAKALPDAPDGLFDDEADGLHALADAGAATPGVHLVVHDLLVLDALDRAPRDDPGFWRRLGRMVATMHRDTASVRHGWHRDNFLGRLRQDNAWHDDGHRFFAERRLVRWLRHPVVDEALDVDDRRALEVLGGRLPELVPEQPAVLTHGNLWRGNVVADARGDPVLVDPSVSRCWAEVDLAMLSWAGPPAVTAAFLDGYVDVADAPDGWRRRRDVVLLNEWLCQLAHDRAGWDVVGEIRRALAPFRRRP